LERHDLAATHGRERHSLFTDDPGKGVAVADDQKSLLLEPLWRGAGARPRPGFRLSAGTRPIADLRLGVLGLH
jgi:hypothetical protein